MMIFRIGPHRRKIGWSLMVKRIGIFNASSVSIVQAYIALKGVLHAARLDATKARGGSGGDEDSRNRLHFMLRLD